MHLSSQIFSLENLSKSSVMPVLAVVSSMGPFCQPHQLWAMGHSGISLKTKEASKSEHSWHNLVLSFYSRTPEFW